MPTEASRLKAFQRLFSELVTGALAHSTDPVGCAEFVADRIRELLGIEAVCVIACEAGGVAPRALTVRPDSHEKCMDPAEVDRLIRCGGVSGSAMRLERAAFDDRDGAGLNSKDSVIVPLRVGDDLVGVLALYGLGGEAGLNPALDSLDHLSSLLALIIRNADQYRDLELAVLRRTAELRAARDRLEEQHGFLSSLLASLPTPVSVLDGQGRILRCNESFGALVGKTASELVGEFDASVGGCFAVDGRATDASEDGELECRFGDGGVRRMLSSRAPFFNSQGRPAGYIRVLTDVTELARARQAAEASDKAKTEFLANMSHEIRTPLNGILSMLQLLSRTQLEEDQKDCVFTAIRSSRRLTQLLTDILDISRLEAGKLDIFPTEFHFSDLTDSVRDLFAIPAKAKGLELRFTIDSSIPRFVVGDEGRVRQILFNLVGNAVKFTPQGVVRVTARRVERPGGMAVNFRVVDTGIGIPSERLEEIFHPFTQVDGSAVRAHGGVGLGLAIVKRLVEMLGGHISVSSEPGRGTVIDATIPLQEGKTVRPAEEPVFESELVRRHILVVEDDRVNQLALTRMLQKIGHSAVVAGNGQEALEALQKEHFDCVLMDIQMPVMDGVEATRRIRSAGNPDIPAAIPIIALTGHAMSGDRERFLAEGMSGYLSKPVDMDGLAVLIAEVTAGCAS